MIDSDGFRPNVGIIICNRSRSLLWARRVGQDAWQFPQGGIRSNETPEEALYRELAEEVGLLPEQVDVLGSTRGWLRYRLPEKFIRRDTSPVCLGQKQVWYLLRTCCEDHAIQLDSTNRPEFDRWRWVDYWYPLREVITFKRPVYKRALRELAPLVFPDGAPAPSADS